MYDYTKSGALWFKRVTVAKSYPTYGVLSKSLDWSRAFDTVGRLVTEYYPVNHRLDYGYDLMDRPNVMNWAKFIGGTWQAPTSVVSSVAYKPSGQLSSLSYLGHIESRAYNDRMQVTRIKTTAGASTKMDMEYRFHSTANDGRITQSKDWVSGSGANFEMRQPRG